MGWLRSGRFTASPSGGPVTRVLRRCSGGDGEQKGRQPVRGETGNDDPEHRATPASDECCRRQRGESPKCGAGPPAAVVVENTADNEGGKSRHSCVADRPI